MIDKRTFSKLPWPTKVLVRLGAVKHKVVGIHKYVKLRNWHPATWVWLFFMVPLNIFTDGWRDTKESFGELFKWRRYK